MTPLDKEINKWLMTDTIVALEALHQLNPKTTNNYPLRARVERTPQYMSLKSTLIELARECPENLFYLMLKIDFSESLKEIFRIEGMIE